MGREHRMIKRTMECRHDKKPHKNLITIYRSIFCSLLNVFIPNIGTRIIKKIKNAR